MIGQHEFAEAARYQDALSEEHAFEDYCRLAGVDPEGLTYIAEQRALRVAMLIDGHDLTKLSRTEKTPIRLSQQAKKLMPSLTALAMDGVCIGLAARRTQDA